MKMNKILSLLKTLMNGQYLNSTACSPYYYVTKTNTYFTSSEKQGLDGLNPSSTSLELDHYLGRFLIYVLRFPREKKLRDFAQHNMIREDTSEKKCIGYIFFLLLCCYK